MKITLFQQDIVWCNPQANYEKIEQALKANPESDLLVLPEMCTTGFITNPEPGGLELDSEVELQLVALSMHYDTAIAGSVAVRDAQNVNYNRFYFITPDGEVHKANKRHLFSYGGEQLAYQRGEERTIVTYQGIRFLILVCYDLRFPVWSRCKDDYDIALYVANWPAVRQHSWEVLLQARAIENQCFVVGVNRVGKDVLCDYVGGSMAVHPYGMPLVQVQPSSEGCVTFEPDMEKLRSFRDKFPVLQDAERFQVIG